MNDKLIRAKELRLQASALENEAYDEVLPKLFEEYAHLVGQCYEIKNSSGEDSWKEYYQIKKVVDFHLSGENTTIYVEFMKVCLDCPSIGVCIYQTESSYLHIIESMGKQITSEKFQKKLLEAIARL